MGLRVLSLSICRQAEGLAEKLKLDQNLTPEEMEKVGKLAGW